MCGVNITIDNVRDKKVKVSIVGPHSELTQPSGPANACPGSTPHPVTGEGFIEAEINITVSLSAERGEPSPELIERGMLVPEN